MTHPPTDPQRPVKITAAARRAARAAEVGRIRRRRQRRLLVVASLGAVLLTLVAVAAFRGLDNGTGGGQVDFSARFAGYEAAEEPEGDLAKVVWPEFVTRAGPEVQRLYAFHVEQGPLMRYMPCFCGCQFEDGHRNNRDCYIDHVNPDGTVVFDSMAPT